MMREIGGTGIENQMEQLQSQMEAATTIEAKAAITAEMQTV